MRDMFAMAKFLFAISIVFLCAAICIDTHLGNVMHEGGEL